MERKINKKINANLVRFITIILALFHSYTLQQALGQEPITYNQQIKAPLPAPFVADYYFTDWDGDGDSDMLSDTLYTGRMYLHRNIGTAREPMFENGFERDRLLMKGNESYLEPQLLGRFFTMIDWRGDGKKEIIAFEAQITSAKALGIDPVKLNVFRNKGNSEKPEWNVLPVKNTKGEHYLSTGNVWGGPVMDATDWYADGKQDLIIGIYHPKASLPVGNILDDFLNPLTNWDPLTAYVYVLRNVSTSDTPIFEEPVRIRAANDDMKFYGFAYPLIIDINKDNLPDMIVGEHRPGLHVYLNTGIKGKPIYSYRGLMKDEKGLPIKSILAIHPQKADLDADDKPEVVATCYFAFTYQFSIFEHQGGTPEANWKSEGFVPIRTEQNSPVVGQGVTTIEPYDWDGDKDTDLVLGSEPGVLLLVRNIGNEKNRVWAVPERIKFVDGTPWESYSIENGTGEARASGRGPIEWYFDRPTPRIADWDRDGTPDIVSGSIGMRLLWFKGHRVNGELRFERPRVFEMNDEPLQVAHRVQPFVIDWDNDGKLDVLSTDRLNNVTLYRGNSSSTLTAATTLLLKTGERILANPNILDSASGRVGLAVVDWDGDGLRDLLIYKRYGDGLHYYRNTGDASGVKFEEGVRLYESFQGHEGGVTPFDWNNDGYLDILASGDPTNLLSVTDPNARAMTGEPIVSPVIPGKPQMRVQTKKGHLFVMDGAKLTVPPKRRTAATN